jgi:phosphonate transport system substrate-binding protein
MKKLLTVLLALLMVFGLAACNGSNSGNGGEAEGPSKEFEKLTLVFVPSRTPDEILAATSGLGDLVIAEMAKHGYTIGSVDIVVSDSYEAAGEALASGTAEIAWLPGGTYALYRDETQVVLTATRAGLSCDSTNPADWNGDANKVFRSEDDVTFYKGLIYAGTSEKGKALAAKVNAGEKPTWEELADCSWGIANPTSSAGYIYPNLWLMENYGHSITELPTTTEVKYVAGFMQAAAGQIDVMVCYADGRTDYEEIWSAPTNQEVGNMGAGWGREDTIWNECNVIGVTPNIYNDTVSVTKANPDIYNDEFINAFQQSMIDISKTQEGKDIIAIYTHSGYVLANESDYDVTVAALEAMK